MTDVILLNILVVDKIYIFRVAKFSQTLEFLVKGWRSEEVGGGDGVRVVTGNETKYGACGRAGGGGIAQNSKPFIRHNLCM